MARKLISNDREKGLDFLSGLNYDDFSRSKGHEYVIARNAIFSSLEGHRSSISNEISNVLSYDINQGRSFDLKIIGIIYINEDYYVIFSTNNEDDDEDNPGVSEIGIYHADSDEYEIVVNDFDSIEKLNFSQKHLVVGIGRVNVECHHIVYWDDNYNKSRTLTIEEGPYYSDYELGINTIGKTCFDDTPKKENGISLNKLCLHPSMKYPRISLTNSRGSGVLFNGLYYAQIAYMDNNEVVTDYSLPSYPIAVFDHNDGKGCFDVLFDDLDKNYDYFQLIITAVRADNVTHNVFGVYNTNQNRITISAIHDTLPKIDNKTLFITTMVYDKSAGIFTDGKYAYRIQPESKTKFNYQPLANKIKVRWATESVPWDYYKEGNEKSGGTHIGYCRSEIYAFAIRFVYDTGDKSELYHIPGPVVENGDFAIADYSKVLGDDNLENLISDDKYLAHIGKIGIPSPWQSTEKYDSLRNDIWDQLCGKQIRHAKMPSCKNAPLFTETNTNTDLNHGRAERLNILGVFFQGIERPKDKSIVGYEIFRASREGNKSILGSGIINNYRMYYDSANSSSFSYYQNYPYNNHKEDTFLSKCILTQNCDEKKKKDVLYDEDYVSKNLFSFHSPETTFSKPYLNVKGFLPEEKLSGSTKLNFQICDDIPYVKALKPSANIIAIILGLGGAIFEMIGEKEVTYETPKLDFGGNNATDAVFGNQLGGMSNPITIALNIGQAVAAVASTAASYAVDAMITDVSTITSILSGANANEVNRKILSSISAASSALGTTGTETSSYKTTEWSVLPTVIRGLNAVSNFLAEWQIQTKTYYDAIKSLVLAKPRVIQQTSQLLYNKSSKLTSGYQDIEDSGIIGNGNFSLNGRIINNTYRQKHIALQFKNDYEDNDNKATENHGLDNVNDLTPENIPEVKFAVENDEVIYGKITANMSAQYGQIDSCYYVPICDGPIYFDDKHKLSDGYTTPLLFGGDTFIGEYAEKNTMLFFRNFPLAQKNNAEFNYLANAAIQYPRYWIDNTQDPFLQFFADYGTSLTGRNTDMRFEKIDELNDIITSSSRQSSLSLMNPLVNYSNSDLSYYALNDKFDKLSKGIVEYKYYEEEQLYSGFTQYADIQDNIEDETKYTTKKVVNEIKLLGSSNLFYNDFATPSLFNSDTIYNMVGDTIIFSPTSRISFMKNSYINPIYSCVSFNEDDFYAKEQKDCVTEITPIRVLKKNDSTDTDTYEFVFFVTEKESYYVRKSKTDNLYYCFYDDNTSVDMAKNKVKLNRAKQAEKAEKYVDEVIEFVNVTCSYFDYKLGSDYDCGYNGKDVYNPTTGGVVDFLNKKISEKYKDYSEVGANGLTKIVQKIFENGHNLAGQPAEDQTAFNSICALETFLLEGLTTWTERGFSPASLFMPMCSKGLKVSSGIMMSGKPVNYYGKPKTLIISTISPDTEYEDKYCTQVARLVNNIFRCSDYDTDFAIREGFGSTDIEGTITATSYSIDQQTDPSDYKDHYPDVDFAIATPSHDMVRSWEDGYCCFSYSKGFSSTRYDQEDNPISQEKRDDSVLKQIITPLKELKQTYHDRQSPSVEELTENLTSDGGGNATFVQKLKDIIKGDGTLFTMNYNLEDHSKKGKTFDFNDSYMYLAVNSVRRFYTESSYNIACRNYGELDKEKFYGGDIKNEVALFQTKNYKEPVNIYMYDSSFHRLFSNTENGPFSKFLPRDFDELVAETCQTKWKKRIAYSYPQSYEYKMDCWRRYQYFNKKDFDDIPVGVSPFGKNDTIVLFKNTSPLIYNNSRPSTEKVNLVVGSGNLFNDYTQMKLAAGYHGGLSYGCIDDYKSFVNSPIGPFYISEKNAALYGIANDLEQMNEALNISSWSNKYMHYALTDITKDYDLIGNTLLGIGFQSVYDAKTNTVYFSKRDRAILDKYKNDVYFDGKDFFVNGIRVSIDDSNYFTDASWTLSVTNEGRQLLGVSFHDWHPDLMAPLANGFFTTKGGKIYKHNLRPEEIEKYKGGNQNTFCNFYERNFPFEITFTSTSLETSIVRNVEYNLEVYTYQNNGRDRYHVLEENFDEAVVFNSEQCSGLLQLVKSGNLVDDQTIVDFWNDIYPIVHTDYFEIPYNKAEQKYRFNMFQDIVRDRNSYAPIWNVEPNGYISVLNNNALDYEKNEFEKKKIRHNTNSVKLIKNNCGNNNFILSFSILKELLSYR